jgi:hypothetical protein
VVCGVPASGKSSLASALAARSSYTWLSSDAVRKRMAGLHPSTRAKQSHYEDQVNRATYAELGALAASASSGGVIVDATFRHRRDRDAFFEAFGDVAPLRLIECRASSEALARRALRREQDPDRVSDAALEVVMRERTSWEPLDEIPRRNRLELASDRDPAELAASVVEWLDRSI